MSNYQPQNVEGVFPQLDQDRDSGLPTSDREPPKRLLHSAFCIRYSAVPFVAIGKRRDGYCVAGRIPTNLPEDPYFYLPDLVLPPPAVASHRCAVDATQKDRKC